MNDEARRALASIQPNAVTSAKTQLAQSLGGPIYAETARASFGVMTPGDGRIYARLWATLRDPLIRQAYNDAIIHGQGRSMQVVLDYFAREVEQRSYMNQPVVRVEGSRIIGETTADTLRQLQQYFDSGVLVPCAPHAECRCGRKALAIVSILSDSSPLCANDALAIVGLLRSE